MSLLTHLVPAFARSKTSAARETGPSVTPAYGLTEIEDGYELIVHLPGVSKEGLELTAEDGAITVTGRRAWKQPEGWTAIYREANDTPYELVLNHDNIVDLDKVQAVLRDGVLHVTLPKAEAVKPRKISIN